MNFIWDIYLTDSLKKSHLRDNIGVNLKTGFSFHKYKKKKTGMIC